MAISVDENIQYSMLILEHHQEVCGELVFKDGEGELSLVCSVCGLEMKKCGMGAQFSLKGYKFELV
jgi:hypothetical protein